MFRSERIDEIYGIELIFKVYKLRTYEGNFPNWNRLFFRFRISGSSRDALYQSDKSE
jgi:hypothetical protein